MSDDLFKCSFCLAESSDPYYAFSQPFCDDEHAMEWAEKRIKELEIEVTRNCNDCAQITGDLCKEHKKYAFDGGLENATSVSIRDIEEQL